MTIRNPWSFPLNNNTSPRGLLKRAPSVSRHDRDESKSWRTSREQKVRGGGFWCVVEGPSWTLKWQTEGMDERAGRLRALCLQEGGETLLHLIMRWTSPRKLLLLLPSETFPSVSHSRGPAQQPDTGTWPTASLNMHFYLSTARILHSLFLLLTVIYWLHVIISLNSYSVMYSMMVFSLVLMAEWLNIWAWVRGSHLNIYSIRHVTYIGRWRLGER